MQTTANICPDQSISLLFTNIIMMSRISNSQMLELKPDWKIHTGWQGKCFH